MKRNDLGQVDDNLFGELDRGPIEQVRTGMDVIDAAGERIGSVEYVKMGDPEAATIDASLQGEKGLIGDLMAAIGVDNEPDLPMALQQRLLRVGFIKIDGGGLTDSDSYVIADKIASVTEDSVRLAVTRHHLLNEA